THSLVLELNLKAANRRWLSLPKCHPDCPQRQAANSSGRAEPDKSLHRVFPKISLRRLTKIRLQFAIYFCLHTGKFARKHGNLASSEHRPGCSTTKGFNRS